MVRRSRFAFDDSHELHPPRWDTALPFDETDGELPMDVLLNLPDEIPPDDADGEGREDRDDWSQRRAA